MRKLFLFIQALLFINAAWSQAPTANFTVNQTAGCAPLVISFQDQSTGNATSWKWDFGNGNTSTLQNPSATYFSPGVYSVTLTVTNDNGTHTLTRPSLITVYDKPTGAFSADQTAGCFPLNVQFTDGSSASPGTTNVSWQWDFGDGTQSTQQSPRVSFTQAGTFTVNLKITNDKGCFTNVSKNNLIKVADGVKVDFSQSPIDRCQPPFPVQFTNASSGPGTLTYLWSFGDGSTSTNQAPNYVYTAPGNYDVSLAVTSSNGCTDTLRKQALISIPKIVTGYTAPDSICILTPVSFANTSTPQPQGSFWQFGDGSNASTMNAQKAYTSPGIYNVQLVNNYGYCTDTILKPITILPRPAAQFSASNTIQCKPPLNVPFQDGSTNAVRWQWDFGDGQTSTQQNPVHTYTGYGNFTVRLVVTNQEGCTDTLVKPAFVKIQKPLITFPNLPANGCIPYSTTFTSSVNTLDNVTSYAWNFGDGGTSNSATPSYTYTTQGTYTATLIITTSTGCTDSLVLPAAITVGRRPIIDFTAGPIPACAFQTVSFLGSANEANGWQWNFGDGSSATEQNPIYAYKDTGNFTVSLTVNNNGCFETITKDNYITIKPPIARFQFTKDCNQQRRFYFQDQSIGATTWLWDFGDGSTSSASNPQHDFPSAGTYTVSLTVTNDTCSHTSTQSLQVFTNTVAFSANNREACKTAIIQYSSLVPNVSQVAAYEWIFENTGVATLPNPAVTYSSSGNFSTTLIATDIYGCKDTAFQKDYIRINGPTALFTAANTVGCKGLTARFTDGSITDGRHTITQWQWAYGDSTVEQFSNPAPFRHVYSNAGIYTVQLTVTDAAGCQDSLQINNLVKTSDPKADFASADTLTCLGSKVSFTNTSTAQNFTSVWDFGDGTSSTLPDPIHDYLDTGRYTVRLTITDDYGCSDSTTRQRFVTIQKTEASYLVSDSIGGCVPFQVNFTNTSSFYEASQWKFGNSYSNITNPAYTFFSAGTYPITLAVRGRGGCTDTAYSTITVYDDSATSISYTPLEGCRPLQLQVSLQTPVTKNYSWDFGDGTIVTTSQKDTFHRYITYGNYIPRLILSDSGNCVIPYVGKDTVRVYGLTTRFDWDRKLLCDSGVVMFSDSTISNENITGYTWQFGDGTSSSLPNPSHTYQQPGLYTVTLTTQSSSSCQDTAQAIAAIKIVQSPSIGIRGDTALCLNESAMHWGVYLQSDTSEVKWNWTFPNGLKAVTTRPATQRYSIAGNYTIEAIATNSSGCTDTAYHPLKVHPLPSVSVPPVFTSRVGTPVTIQPAVYASNVASYLWTPATGLSCTNCPQPIATPKSSTTYQVLVTDSNGCRNSTDVLVTVYCNGSNVFVPNTFSPNGDGSNDVFFIRGTGLARVKSLRIFNRLGEVVFERQNFAVNDATAGWDGMFKGKKALPDTYVYQVDVFCENNETIRIDGSLALIL